MDNLPIVVNGTFSFSGCKVGGPLIFFVVVEH